MARDIRTRFAGAATRLGIPIDEYIERVASGFKWCSGARHWTHNEDFNRNACTADGLNSICRACLRTSKRNRAGNRQDVVAEALESLRGGAK